MRLVNRAHRHGDAEALQRRLEEQEDTLEEWSIGEEFHLKRLACLGIDDLLIPHFVTGLSEQAQSLTKIVANRSRIAADRIGVGLCKNFGGDLVTHGFQKLELPAGRQSGGREFGAFEIAGGALILPKEDLLVHLLEVECIVEGKPNPRILEFVTTQVEGECLHHTDVIDWKLFEDYAFLIHR